MNRIATRRLLFAVFLLTLPVPYMLGAVEVAPWLRLAFLTSLLGSVFAVEGGPWIGTMAGLGVAQTLLYLALLYAAAVFVAALLTRIGALGVRRVATAIVVVGLLGYSLGDPYQTAISSTRARSSLTHLFQ
jgi:hypothetical protein